MSFYIYASYILNNLSLNTAIIYDRQATAWAFSFALQMTYPTRIDLTQLGIMRTTRVIPAGNSWSLWASCQIRKIVGRACAGNAGNVFSRHRLQRKLLDSDPGMHHGTCVAHVPWCMSGSLTCGQGETFPAFPAHAQPAVLRILQEAFGKHLWATY